MASRLVWARRAFKLGRKKKRPVNCGRSISSVQPIAYNLKRSRDEKIGGRMVDINSVKLPGLSLFLCAQSFQVARAFKHFFDAELADIYLNGLRCRLRWASNR